MIRDEKNRVRGLMIVAIEIITVKITSCCYLCILDIYDSENNRAAYKTVQICNYGENFWRKNFGLKWRLVYLDSVQFSSVAQSCLTLCNTMNHSTSGLPVNHQLPEFTQTHVHWVGDAIQPSHPLSSPSPPALNLSQHQGLFKWISSSHEVAKVLEFQLQHQSFQRTSRTDLFKDALVGSPCSPRDSQESSPTPQFKSINSSVLSFLYSPILTSILG